MARACHGRVWRWTGLTIARSGHIPICLRPGLGMARALLWTRGLGWAIFGYVLVSGLGCALGWAIGWDLCCPALYCEMHWAVSWIGCGLRCAVGCVGLWFGLRCGLRCEAGLICWLVWTVGWAGL
jgi:hypothetical protein